MRQHHAVSGNDETLEFPRFRGLLSWGPVSQRSGVHQTGGTPIDGSYLLRVTGNRPRKTSGHRRSPTRCDSAIASSHPRTTVLTTPIAGHS